MKITKEHIMINRMGYRYFTILEDDIARGTERAQGGFQCTSYTLMRHAHFYTLKHINLINEINVNVLYLVFFFKVFKIHFAAEMVEHFASDAL